MERAQTLWLRIDDPALARIAVAQIRSCVAKRALDEAVMAARVAGFSGQETRRLAWYDFVSAGADISMSPESTNSADACVVSFSSDPPSCWVLQVLVYIMLNVISWWSN